MSYRDARPSQPSLPPYLDGSVRAFLEGPGGARFWFDSLLARSPAARQQGLQGRVLEPGRGMLFEFPTDAPQTFWMKGVPAPLDMIFADRNYRVSGVVHGARANDPTSVGGFPAKLVLELRAGEARRMGVGAGWRLSWFVV